MEIFIHSKHADPCRGFSRVPKIPASRPPSRPPSLCFFCSAVMEIFIHIPYEKRPRSYGVLATVGKDLGESWRYISRARQ